MIYLSSDWAILQITKQKKANYSEFGSSDLKQLYFEMCDLNGNKVAGASTIPIPDMPEMAGFRTVIISKLEPYEVVKILQKAGVGVKL